jgi:hypothetical protein
MPQTPEPASMIPVVAAIIAALAAILGIIVNAILTLKNRTIQRELEEFKTEMQAISANRTALLGYQYEARKRLYAECEPLFFQMSESSQEALEAIARLSRENIWTKLLPTLQNTEDAGKPWMINKSSDLISIMYSFYRPLVIYCLLREKMTIVDYSLDSAVSYRYDLARILFTSLYDDEEIAKIEPIIPYYPIVDNWRKKRIENPAMHWWQGVTRGRLDRILQMLIVADENGKRPITFGEFEDLYLHTLESGSSENQKTLGVAANALYGFTPDSRPVFWRILMIQAHVHLALSRPVPSDIENIRMCEKRIKDIIKLESNKIFNIEPVSAVEKAEPIAQNYLINRLKRIDAK